MQGVRSPILRVLTAFDQTSILEFIQEGYQPTWQDGEPATKLLLTEARRGSDDSEDPRVRACQAQLCQPFAKLSRCVGPDLRQQERRGPCAPRDCAWFL
jgi:hypothetical protein